MLPAFRSWLQSPSASSAATSLGWLIARAVRRATRADVRQRTAQLVQVLTGRRSGRC